SAAASTSSNRAAYGAPDAPVMPRNTLNGVPCRRRRRGAAPPRPLLRALRRDEELAELSKLVVAERGELRHHVVALLARIGDVRGVERRGPALRPLGAQVWRAEVRRADAEVGVTRGTAGGREHLRAGQRLR